MEKCPIIINGINSGELRHWREGLMTVFEATARYSPEIVRLWVYGGDFRGYVGIMAPQGDKLYLKRRMSAAAIKNFPRKIEYAAPEGEALPQPKPVEAEPEPEPVKEVAVPPADEEDDGLLWFSTPEGTLTAFDGEKSLIAIPARLRGGVEGIRRNINGIQYVVFPGRGYHK